MTVTTHILAEDHGSYYNTLTQHRAERYDGRQVDPKRRYGLKTIKIRYFRSEDALRKYVDAADDIHMSW